MRLALAQINTVVGDLDGNVARIVGRIREAKNAGADLVLFPELAITGYPPEDLLFRPGFLRGAARGRAGCGRDDRHRCARWRSVARPRPRQRLRDLRRRRDQAVYPKRFLPNYGVFDEVRYFQPGREMFLLRVGEALVGPTVCEDIWQPGPPATDLALAGAHVIANISASPFHVGKGLEREEMLITRARDNACWVALVNAVGGQDELIFDGHSVVIDEEGEVVARAPSFEEALLVVDIDVSTAIARRLVDARRRALASEREIPDPPVIDLGGPREQQGPVKPYVAEPLDELEQMRRALELGLSDYVEKNGFGDVVLGVSGGIDSALTAALAVEALGPDRVHCVSMPSRYSSDDTRRDAERLAKNLDTDFLELPIDSIFDGYEGALECVRGTRGRHHRGEPPGPHPRDAADGAVEQVRLARRGDGEQVGALGRVRHALRGHGRRVRAAEGRVQDGCVPARQASERPHRTRADPETIIERAPSAELRADQKDEDSLPPYSALDRVLEAYVEEDRSHEELTTDGFDQDVVDRAIALIDRAEYKRRQAPPGVKLRPKAFGRDRRTPITNRWRG